MISHKICYLCTKEFKDVVGSINNNHPQQTVTTITPMKVAYLLGSLSRGGTETLLLDVFKKSSAAPFEFIGIHRKGGELQEEFQATEPAVYQLGPKGKHYFKYLRQLRKLLLDNNIQVAHAQQFIDCIYAKLATIGTSIKVVQTFHGYDFDGSNLDKKLINFSFKLSDADLFVSQTQQDYYVEQYHLQNKLQKLHVNYNGVNFDKLDNGIHPVELPNYKPGDATVINMAMVGSFLAVRNQFLVCKFLKLLKDAGVKFNFYFAGRRVDSVPHFYDNCVKYCQENDLMDCVHFLGVRNDVPALLAQMDAFVYSTDHDTFGIAVIEAIAQGIPTFANDWKVLEEVTNNGTLAHIYKTNDENDLFNQFNDFLQNIDRYKAEAEANAKSIREMYSIENHINRLTLIYKQL